MNELEKTNAVCFFLIKICRDTNATKLRIVQENVTVLGENIGDWEIIARKINKK